MRNVGKVGGNFVWAHTGDRNCCDQCRKDADRFDAWYAERFPQQAAARQPVLVHRGAE